MTTKTYTNRSGVPVKVGDLVDVLSFGADGVEGGTVVGFRKVTGRAVAKIEQASGRTVEVAVSLVVPR